MKLHSSFIISIILTAVFATFQFAGMSQKGVAFKIKNAGLTVNGSFSDFKVDINYNPTAPTQSTFNGTIQVKSINTGINSRDKHLMKDEYFDVARFPTMVFNSTSVKSNNAGSLSVTGDLTIKGKTQKITIPVKVEKIGEKYRFVGSIKINRLTFGVGESSWVTADDLIINIDVTK